MSASRPAPHPSSEGRSLEALAGIDIERLEGPSPKKREALRSLGASSVLDLLWLYPRRYIDRTRQADLADLAVGERPDIAVLIDSWGFTLRVAQRLRRRLKGVGQQDVEVPRSVQFSGEPFEFGVNPQALLVVDHLTKDPDGGPEASDAYTKLVQRFGPARTAQEQSV